MKSLTQFIKESLIKENFGEFKNAQEISTKIIDTIKENENKNKLEIDVSEFDLPFKTIVLTIDKIDYDYLNGSYLYKETDFILAKIYINITFNKLYEKDLIKIMIHELTHAICDFNLNKVNKSLNHLLISKNFKNVQSCRHAYSVSSNEIYSKHYNIHNKIIYFLNNAERNAYLSRLKSDVYDILDKNEIDIRSSNGYENLIKKIKNIPTMNEIFNIGYFIENIDKLPDNDLRNFVLKYKSSYISPKSRIVKIKQNDLIKEIKQMWAKFVKKFNEYVPKICAEYYEKHIL